MAWTCVWFCIDQKFILLVILEDMGALLIVPPIEIPLPLVLANASAPRYMYVSPSYLSSSLDHILPDVNVPIGDFLELSWSRGSGDLAFA